MLLASGVASAEPAIWRYGYDPLDRPTTIVSPIGQTTHIYYDALGRPQQMQQPANTGETTPTVTDLVYDLGGALKSVKDSRGVTTNYVRDGLRQTRTQNSPDSGDTSVTYDARGRVRTRTDARGRTATLTYDALDRIVKIVAGAAAPISFEYDGGDAPYSGATGQLTKMTDASGQTTFDFDSAGRLIRKTSIIAGKAFTVAYSWGESGPELDKLIGITYPSGSRVNYGYSRSGVVEVSVTPVSADGAGLSASSLPLLSEVSQSGEQITGWSWSDGTRRTIDYDGRGFVSGYNLGNPLGTGAAAGMQRTLQRDAAGRILGFTHTSNGQPLVALDQSFTYDDLDRLVSAVQGSTATQYSYDSTGNRTARTIAGVRYDNTISANSNRLVQVRDTMGTATIAHDAMGNIIGDASSTYVYNDMGRLSSASGAAGTVAYSYNGFGQRVAKNGPTNLVPTGSGFFVYDEGGRLLGEYGADGTPLYETVYLEQIPVGVMKLNGTAAGNNLSVSLYNVYTDHIAAPRVITRQDQSIVWRWDTAEAFGFSSPDQNPNGLGAFVYNQRFPGQVFDAETGLFQNWYRDYDPRLGRYRQSDPIGLSGGINTYAYAYGNPLRYADPLGLYTEVVFWRGVGGGESQFGHISTNINGENYSWAPPGQWDTKYPSASDYNARQQMFRDGSGVILNLTPEQEKALAACMKAASGSYNVISNNCGTSVQDCLQKVGVQFNKALRPVSIYESLRDSPSAIGNTIYPGPERNGEPLDNPSVWGF
ncbi:RHS repeat-associated core domain-containing protein [Ramlibacter humi]|nr:RHS repeat protein [Ramlibacter humi]